MKVPLHVLGDRILVLPDREDRAPEATPSGLIIAASLAAAVTGTDPVSSWCRGTVMAIGTPRHPLREEARDLAKKLDKRAVSETSETRAQLLCDAAELLRDLVRREPCVAVGDDVLFAHDAGQEVHIDQDTMILLKEDELLAVVTPDA